MSDSPSPDLSRLLRWRDAGGTWVVASETPDAVTVALGRCDAGEEIERYASSASDLRDWIDAHRDDQG